MPKRAPALVTLHSQRLGIDQTFTPDHAARILARQAAQRDTQGWLPASPSASAPANSDAAPSRRRPRPTPKTPPPGGAQ